MEIHIIFEQMHWKLMNNLEEMGRTVKVTSKIVSWSMQQYSKG